MTNIKRTYSRGTLVNLRDNGYGVPRCTEDLIKKMVIYKVKKPKTKCQYIPKTHQQRNNRVQPIHNKARPYNNERQIHKLKKKGSWYKFRAATLNILSAKDDIYIEQAALAMCRHSITVLAIQEARRTTDDRTVKVFFLKIRSIHFDS